GTANGATSRARACHRAQPKSSDSSSGTNQKRNDGAVTGYLPSRAEAGFIVVMGMALGSVVDHEFGAQRPYRQRRSSYSMQPPGAQPRRQAPGIDRSTEQQQGHPGIGEQAVGDTAEQQLPEPALAKGPHHDQLDAVLLLVVVQLFFHVAVEVRGHHGEAGGPQGLRTVLQQWGVLP